MSAKEVRSRDPIASDKRYTDWAQFFLSKKNDVSKEGDISKNGEVWKLNERMNI